MLGQTYTTSRKMRTTVIHTEEPVSTREVAEKLVKIFDRTYENADLEQVAANKTQINPEERTQLLRILKDFDDLFDGTLGDWDTYPIPVSIRYYRIDYP